MAATAPTAEVAAPERRKRRRRFRITPGAALVYFAAFWLAVFWLIPLLWAVATSIKPEGETTLVPIEWLSDNPTLTAYRQVLEVGDIPRWLLNSFIVSTIVTVLTLVLCSLAAYGFSKCRFPGQTWIFAIIIAGILVPPQVLIVPLFEEISALGIMDTYWGIALPQVVAPVMVFILKRFFDAIPRDYEEAARIDGAGHLRILWNVILPMSRPILAAVGIFTFIGSWNNFLWPFIATTDPSIMTLPVGLGVVQSSYGIAYAQNMAAAVISAVPLLIVFMIFQRQIVTGIAGAGIKG